MEVHFLKTEKDFIEEYIDQIDVFKNIMTEFFKQNPEAALLLLRDLKSMLDRFRNNKTSLKNVDEIVHEGMNCIRNKFLILMASLAYKGDLWLSEQNNQS